ncbi:MAG: crossover junction endodeoxyribonuclease RuvC [Chitinispirillales bacterium]|nr:crossover junction endodeoxyribonuclease RuvC [Chitinispirillales bacterium]
MRILGIDPGSIATGFGVIDIVSSKIRPVEYGVITLNRKEILPIRLCVIFDEIKNVISKNKPDLICVETPFFGKNANSAFVLGQARGVIMLSVGQSDIKFCEYSPTEIKKAVTGNGLATKEQVEYMVKTITGICEEKIKSDAYDAIACAICGYNNYSFTSYGF